MVATRSQTRSQSPSPSHASLTSASTPTTAPTSAPSTTSSTPVTSTSPIPDTGVHLVVLIHGLWGNPAHLKFITNALETAFKSSHESSTSTTLRTLVAQTNSGTYTYDGIELGGERVTKEIESEIATIQSSSPSKSIPTKISIVGYSLGRLIARYAIGLLHARGWFDKITPVNFTTFATPHLGSRTPLVGWQNDLFNTLGSKTVSKSGAQLFIMDTFRDTSRPLLAVLADPSSIFIAGLRRFRHHSLYANIINDRAVPFYTASISSYDPFIDLDAIDLHPVADTDGVILDSDAPATQKTEPLTWQQSIANSARNAYGKAPLALAATAILPIGSVAFLVNAGWQNWNSARRIEAHEKGRKGSEWEGYDVELMMQKGVEGVMQRVAEAGGEAFLDGGDATGATAESTADGKPATGAETKDPKTQDEKPEDPAITAMKKKQAAKNAPFPTLSLTPDQFAMIDSLDSIGFKKYPVHIKRASHSHAAMIVRMRRDAFRDGEVVAKHWTERFVY